MNINISYEIDQWPLTLLFHNDKLIMTVELRQGLARGYYLYPIHRLFLGANDAAICQ